MISFLWSPKWWVGSLPKIQVKVTKGSGLVSKNSCFNRGGQEKKEAGSLHGLS